MHNMTVGMGKIYIDAQYIGPTNGVRLVGGNWTPSLEFAAMDISEASMANAIAGKAEVSVAYESDNPAGRNFTLSSAKGTLRLQSFPLKSDKEAMDTFTTRIVSWFPLRIKRERDRGMDYLSMRFIYEPDDGWECQWETKSVYERSDAVLSKIEADLITFAKSS